MIRSRILPHLCLVIAPALAAQMPAPLTRAERSDYAETSRYDDVVSFLVDVTAASPNLTLATFGYSFEGRSLPLVVAGRLSDPTAEAVHASGKTRVLIQANIHAGEVSGKEAVLMLLRELAAGEHEAWLDSLVVLVAPIYNADGNERVRLTNRPRQHGPVGGMGQRANAQGLDLNRDHMKMESPEARSLIALLSTYDPHVVIDLHTTNGTRHGYHLTYAPPLHPNTDAEIDAYLRNDLLPDVTRHIRDRYGWHMYYYGNLPFGGRGEPGWYTFDHRPRFNSNYVGLRNRLGILSEAYSYATFEDRVIASLRFVTAVLDRVHRDATHIRNITDAADRASIVGTEQTLRAAVARSDEPVEILLGEVIEERNPYSGAVMLRRSEAVRRERMYEYGTFRATETEIAPSAYLIPPRFAHLADALRLHGIAFERLESERVMQVEHFLVDSTTAAEREFQGHRERTVYGAWQAAEAHVAKGSLVVPLDQPLGRLVFMLLEPRSDDGWVNWNVFDGTFEETGPYLVWRVP